MAGDDVPPSEMQLFSSPRDPIDAVLTGDSLDEDLLDVVALVHDVRAAYLSEYPLRRRPELVAYTGPTAATEMHLNASGPPGHAVASAPPASAACPDGLASVAEPPRAQGAALRRVASVIAGLAGTITGKVILGTAAAATTVGGLHSAHVVDLPILPDPDRPASEEPAGTGSREDTTGDPSAGQPRHQAPEGHTSDEGDRGPGQGTGNRSASEVYREEVQDWNDCVAAAVAQNDLNTEATSELDPRVVCGEKPEPADFGLGNAPSPTPGNGDDDAGNGASDGGPGKGAPDRAPVPDEAPASGQTPAPDSNPAGPGGSAGHGSDGPAPGAGPGNAGGGAADAGGNRGKAQRPLDTPGGPRS